jgi:hypothetical protein
MGMGAVTADWALADAAGRKLPAARDWMKVLRSMGTPVGTGFGSWQCHKYRCHGQGKRRQQRFNLKERKVNDYRSAFARCEFFVVPLLVGLKIGLRAGEGVNLQM